MAWTKRITADDLAARFRPGGIRMAWTKRITADDLAAFKRSDKLYRHPNQRLLFTPGVLFLAGSVRAYWLIDLIATHQLDHRIGRVSSQLWMLRVWTLTKACRVICARDDGQQPLLFHDLEYTDFPALLADTLKLYVNDGVLMLPSEE
jgi:hypothetical protein